jgi:putative SOS response-associated peptidase YedK
MCSRFTLSASATDLVQQFDLAGLPAWSPRYNIAPTQEVLTVVRMPDAHERQARLLRWGLIPQWAEGPVVGSRMINARIRLRDRRPFAFAGLWERWAPQDGQPLDSCSIITTVANDLIQPLHVRMPAILPPAENEVWLDASVQEVERLQPLLRPYPPEEMEAHPVSTRVNNPANDTPGCIERLMAN